MADGQAAASPSDSGFMEEGAAPPAAAPARAPRRRSEEWRRNLKAVFGHGLGKMAMIATVSAIVLMLVFGVRALMAPPAGPSAAPGKVDVPEAPAVGVSVEPVSPKEAERRAQVAAEEAGEAAAKGMTYQPAFTPVVEGGPAGRPPTPGQAPAGTAALPAQPPGVASTEVSAPPVLPAPAQNDGALAAQQAEERRQQQAVLDAQIAARDKFVESVRNATLANIEKMLEPKDAGARPGAGFSSVAYLPKAAAPAPAGAAPAAPASVTGPAPARGRAVLFKAGSIIFATLDAEVNTDDGGAVFATVRGGAFNGAKLLGKIEQAPENIRLKFEVLAPQDQRPTIAINAVAIRESDAKQGVANIVDRHILERYTTLFAGSMLAGLGKAAMQPQGTSVVQPNGQLVVTNPTLTPERIAMFALGEVGTNAGAAVKKGFSRPPTYITPANTGIGVVFLADVGEP